MLKFFSYKYTESAMDDRVRRGAREVLFFLSLVTYFTGCVHVPLVYITIICKGSGCSSPPYSAVSPVASKC